MHLSRRAAAVLLAFGLIVGPSTASAVAAPAPVSQQSKPVSPSAWAKKQWGTFATWSRSGVGDDVLSLPKSIKAALVQVQHDGESNFAIWALDRSNKQVDLLVNEIGAYTATVPFGLEEKGRVRGLEINADGAWTVTLKPIGSASLIPKKGTGSGVYLLPNRRTARISHDGERNFIVIQHTGGRWGWNLVVNTIGDYKGTVRLDRGPSVIEVDADGQWTVAAR